MRGCFMPFWHLRLTSPFTSLASLVCTVWWMGHHMLIHDLDRVDSRLLWLNCMFLMWIAILLPFPTGLLGHHPRQPVAILLYGAVCAIACTVMRWYASFRGRLMRREISDMKLRRDLRISLCFPFVYLAAAAVGFFSYAAIPTFYTVSRLVKHLEPATSPANLSR